jgi:hypothetical protein
MPMGVDGVRGKEDKIGSEGLRDHENLPDVVGGLYELNAVVSQSGLQALMIDHRMTGLLKENPGRPDNRGIYAPDHVAVLLAQERGDGRDMRSAGEWVETAGTSTDVGEKNEG